MNYVNVMFVKYNIILKDLILRCLNLEKGFNEISAISVFILRNFISGFWRNWPKKTSLANTKYFPRNLAVSLFLRIPKNIESCLNHGVADPDNFAPDPDPA